MHDRFFDTLEEDEEGDYFELPPSPSLAASKKKRIAEDIAALKLGPVAAEEGLLELPLGGNVSNWRKEGPFKAQPRSSALQA